MNSSQKCHSHFNNTQTVGNTAYKCIPVEKSNKTGNVPSQKSKTCAIEEEENCRTYMRQYMRKRRADESNDDRAKRLKVQRDAYKERKAMLGHVISVSVLYLKVQYIHVAVVTNYGIGIVSYFKL